eukprot:gene6053-7275_t
MNFNMRRPPHVLCELELPRCESVPVGQKRSGLPRKSLEKLPMALDTKDKETSALPFDISNAALGMTGLVRGVCGPAAVVQSHPSAPDQECLYAFNDRRLTREVDEDVESVWSLKWDVKPVRRTWDAKAGKVKTVFEEKNESPLDTPH